MVDTYFIGGRKEWSSLYWQGVFMDKNRKERHDILVDVYLRMLRGEFAIMNIGRQYGAGAAWEEAKLKFDSHQLTKNKKG